MSTLESPITDDAPTARPFPLPVGVVLCGLSMVGILAGIGCGGVEAHQAWERDVLEVQNLHQEQRYEEAERRYRALLEQTDDPEQRSYVRLQLAELAVDRGEVQEAMSRYEAIWSDPVEEAHAARALTTHAELVRRHDGDDERANEMLQRLIKRFPETSWGEQAAERLAEWHREHDRLDELRGIFETLHEAVGQTTIGDDLWYVLATAFAEASDQQTALLYFERVIEQYPDGDRIDDAEWDAAQLHLDRQEWGPAVDKLERVADRYIPSWFIGAYSSPHASKARYRLGFIHLTHLGNYETAIDHFETYLDNFPANRRADDALWHIVQAYRLMEEESERAGAVERLRDEYPKSRYLERLPSTESESGSRR